MKRGDTVKLSRLAKFISYFVRGTSRLRKSTFTVTAIVGDRVSIDFDGVSYTTAKIAFKKVEN